MYALSQGAERVATILYPTLAGAASEARIQIHEPLNQHRLATVIQRPVHLLRLEKLIVSNDARKMAVYAQELAFGAAPSHGAFRA